MRSACVPCESVFQFAARAAGEQGELGAPGPFFQAVVRDQPFFAGHVSGVRLCAPVEFHELRFHLFVGHRFTERRDPVGGEAPVVVVAGKILPVVDLGEGRAVPGEEMDGVDDGLVERAVDVDQDAVHIENDEFGRKLHRMPFMARNSLRVSARVPALMRTKPSRGKSFRSRMRIPSRSRAFTRRWARGPKSARMKLAPLG